MNGEHVALTTTRAWLLLKAIDAESIADYYAGNWQTDEAEFWRKQAMTYRRLHSASERGDDSELAFDRPTDNVRRA